MAADFKPRVDYEPEVDHTEAQRFYTENPLRSPIDDDLLHTAEWFDRDVERVTFQFDTHDPRERYSLAAYGLKVWHLAQLERAFNREADLYVSLLAELQSGRRVPSEGALYEPLQSEVASVGKGRCIGFRRRG